MKERLLLKQHEVTGFELMLDYIGVLLMLIGGIVLLPLLTLLWYPEEAYEAKYFILPGIGSILLGYLLFYNIRGRETGRLQRNQDAVIVVTCWILAIMICALPFLLSGNYTFTQAVFETTSAWSTTGLSVVDVEHTSHLFLMHRSTILFFGGIGLVLVMLSVLSDTYGMRLYAAEGHNDHLLPNLLKSARIILTMYLCYILSGVALYCLFGMPLFDALIHSIGALSTGGFSSHAQSIGYYDNIWIEMITIVLMLLGNINFLAHLFLIRGKLRNFFQYCEIRFSFLVIALAVPGFGIPVMRGYGDRPAACAANCIVSSRIRINDNRLSNGGHVCDAALRSSAFIDCTAADRWRHRINCRRNQAVSHLCAMQGHLVEYRKSTALRKCDSFP